MPKPNYSTWLNKQQAADALGVSTKTIEQLAKDKKLQQAYWKRPETGAKVSVYHPADVERLRKERSPDAPPFVLPPGAEEQQTSTTALAVPSMERFFRAIAAAAAGGSESSQNRSEVRIAERLYLTIPEAANFSGLPQAHLRRLMKDEKLEALRTGAGWRIRRSDLEKL
jgi:excisionase family DNA binding protein